MQRHEMPVTESVDTAPKLKIADVLMEVGLDIESVSPKILERLELLNEVTKTVEDGEHAIAIARDIFEHYDANKPEEAFSELEKKIVIMGSLFSDIGKTGPKEASPEQQRLIVEMFAVEAVMDPNTTVADFLKEYFRDDHEIRAGIFTEMGLSTEMTMRGFWNLHSQWTLEIIGGDGIPPEAVVGAASHHIIDGVNPLNIVDGNMKFTKYFGENASFNRPEKLITILDKYDAFLRRGKKTKEAAIELLKNIIAKNALFSGDAEFLELIDDLALVVQAEVPEERKAA